MPKYYMVYNVINVPNDPDYYSVKSPQEAFTLIQKMAAKQLKDKRVRSNVFGLIASDLENPLDPSEDDEGSNWYNWYNEDGDEIDTAGKTGNFAEPEVD